MDSGVGRDGELGAGGVGGELRGVLALDGGDAGSKLTGVIDPHVIAQAVDALGERGDEDVCGIIIVLAVEAQSLGKDRLGKLFHRFKTSGAVVRNGHILHGFVDMDH